MEKRAKSRKELGREIDLLREQLNEAQETLQAIRKGEVDALVVSGADGEQIFTLRGEQEPYRIFVETMNEGAVMVAPDGTIVYSNQRFAKMVRTPLEKVIGSPFEQYVSAADRLPLEELPRGKKSGGYRWEGALKTSRRTLVPVYLSARSMKAAGHLSQCIIATDITARKVAEQKLRQSERRLRLIVEQIPAAVWTTDKKLRILSASGAGLAAANLCAESLIGKTVPEFLRTSNGKSTSLAAHRAALRGKACSYELELGGRIFAAYLEPLRDAQRTICGVIAVAHDVSKQKRVEKYLRRLSARLLKMQDEERRNIARELHDGAIQGLAAAVINLSMVKESAKLPREPRKALEEALKLTGNAVREIRTFSYLLHPPLLDVTGLASALRWYVEGYSRRSGIKVNLDLAENGHPMEKEVELTLFRIVQEALANIHRHSGGQQATIRLEPREEGMILTVADDGHGMDAATLEKVRSEGAALGVGIAGMKERLRQLGGRLEIASSNRGTTVTAALSYPEKRKDEAFANLDRRRS